MSIRLSILLPFLLTLCPLFAEPLQETAQPTLDATIPSSTPSGIMVQQITLKEIVDLYPAINPDELLAFCDDVAPDMLDEWKRLCNDQTDKAKGYLELLAKRFLKACAIRERDTADYDRFVSQLKTETQIRAISRQIQLLGDSDADRSEEREQLKRQLSMLMEKAFDDAQLQQQIEINRLENEVRNLRSLAEERATNKQNILRQRFLLLTGEEWP